MWRYNDINDVISTNPPYYCFYALLEIEMDVSHLTPFDVILFWLVGLCCLTPLSTIFQLYCGGDSEKYILAKQIKSRYIYRSWINRRVGVWKLKHLWWYFKGNKILHWGDLSGFPVFHIRLYCLVFYNPVILVLILLINLLLVWSPLLKTTKIKQPCY